MDIPIHTRLFSNDWVRLGILVIVLAMVCGQGMIQAKPRIVVLTDIGL